MPTERDFEWLREQVLSLRDDMAALKTWRDNERTKTATTPAWVIGVLSVSVAIASLLLNVWIANGGPK